MSKLTEVVALEAGHDGTAYRHAGERFLVDLEDARYEGVKWFVKPGEEPEAPPKPKDKRPPGAGPAKGSKADGYRDQPGAGPQ